VKTLSNVNAGKEDIKEIIMAVRKLEKQEWRSFLDVMSKLLEAKDAEIEVASLQLGDQIEAEWLPLLGISYDPRDDVLDIALDGFDHIIRKPREIYLDNGDAALTSLEIVDADGVKQIVKLKDRLTLPAPRS
jgi:Family of unknown function (DUF5335)